MDTDLTKPIENFYKNYQGASDFRTPEEKDRDIKQTEFVASAAPVVWVEKKPEDFRSFPVLNQFFTFKCVAFTIAKLALINFWLKTKEFLKFSPNYIYDYRVNKPDGGMIGDDAFKIWQEIGITLESICKSDQIQEGDPFEISLFAKESAKGFKLGGHITIDNGDFDRVCSTIQTTGKGVMTWFYFTEQEWSKTYPKIIDGLIGPYESRSLRHSVTAVDFGLIKGVQYIKIEDSAHFGNKRDRFITREMFTQRNFLTKYPMSFNYDNLVTPVTPKPTYIFVHAMKYGDKNQGVKLMQDALKYFGCFPLNVESTGFYGNLTAQSVLEWQKQNQVDTLPILEALQGRSFGPKSMAKINLLISNL